MKEKLNLGCGNDYRTGYTNVDRSEKVNPDFVCDIETAIPFRDNTFDEVLCNNVLTQILQPRVFVGVMNNLWRITKPDGKLFIRVPLATHPCAFQDPMDVRRFTDQSFTYMEWGHRRYVQYGIHYGFRPFKVEIIKNNGIQLELCLTPKK